MASKIFQETEDSATVIKGEIVGLAEGKHGFHIHTFSPVQSIPRQPGCVSAGELYLCKAHQGSANRTDAH